MQLHLAKAATETGFIKGRVLPSAPYLYLLGTPPPRIPSEFQKVRTTRHQRSNVFILQRLRETRSFLQVLHKVRAQSPRTPRRAFLPSPWQHRVTGQRLFPGSGAGRCVTQEAVAVRQPFSVAAAPVTSPLPLSLQSVGRRAPNTCSSFQLLILTSPGPRN